MRLEAQVRGRDPPMSGEPGTGPQQAPGQPAAVMWAGLWLEVGEVALAGLEAC